MDDNNERARQQAKAQLEGILEMVENLGIAVHADNDEEIEETQQVIQEDPLSVEVRSMWHSPGSQENENDEYRILLCTGGPAVQIIGDLNQYNEPETANIQYQDWFTKWETLPTTSDEEEKMVDYARCFWFGE